MSGAFLDLLGTTRSSFGIGPASARVTLVAEAANVLALRNGVNIQTQRFYYSYTDSSNYTRMSLGYQEVGFGIRTEYAGSGATTNIEFRPSGGYVHCRNIAALFLVNDAFTSGVAFFNTANGWLTLTNRAQTDFDRLSFGGTTASFPALKRSSATLQARLADDSAFGTFAAGKFTLDTDVILERDAANVLALRNSTTSQAFRVYGTYTDASNYERFSISYNGFWVLGADNAGTGNPKGIYLKNPAGYLFVEGNQIQLTNAAGTEKVVLSRVADGWLQLYNAAGTGFTALQFGPADGVSPNLRPNGNVLEVGALNNAVYGPFAAETLKLRTDVVLERDAAGVLALRNGANPHGATIYNTYTDGSNYERAFVGWSSNEFQVLVQEAGSGSARNLSIATIGPLAKFEQLGGTLGGSRLTMTTEFPTVGAVLEATGLGLCDLLLKGASTGSMNMRMEARTSNDYILAPEMQFGTAGDPSFVVGDAGGVMVRKGPLYFGDIDLAVDRDAADILALRRSTNAQKLRVYNTYTDASNYERALFGWTSNELVISTEAAGSGTVRSLSLRPSSEVLFFVAGQMYFGNSAGTSAVQFFRLADGFLWLTNAAANDFNQIVMGPFTSSGISLKKVGVALHIRTGTDGAYADLKSKDLALDGAITSVGDAATSRAALGIVTTEETSSYYFWK